MVVVPGLALISGVEENGYDPVGWRDECSPFIYLAPDGSWSQAHGVTGKRELLAKAREGGTLVLPWVGRYRTTVFQVDDLERAARGLAR